MLLHGTLHSPYKSNVTNRELLFLGTDPQPKLGSATFSAANLHRRGNTDLNQPRVCFDGAPTFWLLNNLLWEEQKFISFLAEHTPLLQTGKISLYEGVTGNVLVQVPTAFIKCAVLKL